MAMPYAMQHGPFGPILPPLEAVDSLAVQRPGLLPPATSEPVAGARGERSGKKRIPCAFYLKTGNCAFGNEWVPFNKSHTPTQAILHGYRL